ncbi:uncharacterized protein N7506_009845 [Penicillium brevicompactum]|uniref:uncharacterized protein n=1 Tax=Penicillium brevicompactum TaxID=5074 RepID=UPI002542330C|nr:uncharacterized protein N7506_009845 [Penicillium brevicompactum]KAJ5326743.1 hypothetical protein N7506_009845 [Penicillium brevicompactum]
MCDVPFFPIFPICFQCGTDQNPCHCKVVGPTLGILLASLYLLWMWLHQDRQGVCSAHMLAYPVKLNGQVSNAIPF